MWKRVCRVVGYGYFECVVVGIKKWVYEDRYVDWNIFDFEKIIAVLSTANTYTIHSAMHGSTCEYGRALALGKHLISFPLLSSRMSG